MMTDNFIRFTSPFTEEYIP